MTTNEQWYSATAAQYEQMDDGRVLLPVIECFRGPLLSERIDGPVRDGARGHLFSRCEATTLLEWMGERSDLFAKAQLLPYRSDTKALGYVVSDRDHAKQYDDIDWYWNLIERFDVNHEPI